MTYTFTEDEIKIFLNWSVYVQGKKEGKEPLNINTNTDYKQVIKQIMNYFED